MEAVPWREKYPKNVKPAFAELLDFLPEPVRVLFQRFNEEMSEKYRVYNKWHRFHSTKGWVYGYCRNYRCELLYISIGEGCFNVLGEDVTDEESLRRAFQKAKEAYDSGYEARYAALSETKRSNQIERSKTRVAREQAQLEQIKEQTDPERFNRFRWTPKVSRSKILALYKSEAAGLLDEALLDDVGYAFYLRCRQARETRDAMDKGKLICHHCEAILQPTGYAKPVTCVCGYSYTYREYRRSCNAANIPGGRATPIFHHFAEKWPECRDAKAKMLLIDWLIHECHVTVMSGEQGRSVCANLVEGTLGQLRDMLKFLAGH